MGGINLNKKLWRMPQKGMVRGVCAGIADYLDVPVKLVRILVVLSIFFGLAFFTVVAYIVLSFVLDPMPDNLAAGKPQPTSGELLDTVDRELAAGEKRLREMERYVTSDTFTLRSRFRQPPAGFIPVAGRSRATRCPDVITPTRQGLAIHWVGRGRGR